MVENTNEVGMLILLLLFASSSSPNISLFPSPCLCSSRFQRLTIEQHSTYFDTTQYDVGFTFIRQYKYQYIIYSDF